MSAISRGIARLSKRKKKQRELPAIIEQDHTPNFPTAVSAELVDHSKPSLLGRSMDRLRKSIRQSFRRTRSHDRTPPALVTVPDGNGRSEAWQPDEANVRAGVCSFSVKYLGATEVYESRGMPICEGALKHLRSLKRHPVKAILYVSGDGLRVVDQENSRGLMVDQTIEKVSFCAPDRNNDKGFAYICRDGTSRRWMCHGFHASKDSGERLSHAVGCAFAICLEKKKKRDEENTTQLEQQPVTVEKALNPDWGDKNGAEVASPPPTNFGGAQWANKAYQSFRKHISMTERLQDPQSAIVNEAPSSSIHQTLPCIAKPRPVANPSLFQRQGSLRAPDTKEASQFRRNFSLRAPATDSPKRAYGTSLNTEPIYEGDEDLVSFVQCSSTPASTSQYSAAPVAPMATSFPAFMDYSSPVHSVPRNGSVRPAVQTQAQPDLMDFNDLLDFNKPISVSTQHSPPGPAPTSSDSRADDWLNNTLKTSMSFGSSAEMPISPSMGSLGSAAAVPASSSNLPKTNSPRNGSAPGFAPPPLPQRPPGVAAPTAPAQASVVNGQEKTNGTDVFGQVVNWEPMSPRHVPRPEDPFDIQWSKMVISANNPFASEQTRITT